MSYTLPHILAGGVLLVVIGVLVWRLEPVWVFTAAIVLSVFAGNWQYMGIPGALAPDRWLLVLGIVAVVVRAPGSVGLPRLRPQGVHGLLALVAIYAIVSAAIVGTLTVKASAFQLFDDLGVSPFLLFLVAPVVFPGPRERRILIGGIVILGAYLGLTALFETLKLTALVFPKYINDPNIGIHYGRARGPFLEAVSNGVALFACALVSGLGVAVFRDVRARVAAGIVMVLCGAGLLFTLQRSVWVASAVAGLGAVLLVGRLRRWAGPAIAVGIVVVIVPLLAFPGFLQTVQSRASQQATVWDRENQDRAALNMINQKPLFGFGWAEFQPKSISYYQQASGYPLTGFGLDVHDAYLRYAVELGLVGVTLWVTAILMALGGALLRRGPPMFYGWKVVAGTFAVFYLIVVAFVPAETFPNLILWLLLGLAWVPRPEPVPVPARMRSTRPTERTGLGVVPGSPLRQPG
jgi:O-antigen ligase